MIRKHNFTCFGRTLKILLGLISCMHDVMLKVFVVNKLQPFLCFLRSAGHLDSLIIVIQITLATFCQGVIIKTPWKQALCYFKAFHLFRKANLLSCSYSRRTGWFRSATESLRVFEQHVINGGLFLPAALSKELRDLAFSAAALFDTDFNLPHDALASPSVVGKFIQLQLVRDAKVGLKWASADTISWLLSFWR